MHRNGLSLLRHPRRRSAAPHRSSHKWCYMQSQEGENKQEYLETLEQKHEQNQATIAQLEQELARLKEEAEEVQVCGPHSLDAGFSIARISNFKKVVLNKIVRRS